MLLSSKLPALFFWVFLATANLPAQLPQVAPLTPPRLWQKSEFRVTDVPAASNHFDPDEIRVDATFTSPSRKVAKVPAFWFQDYTRALVEGAEVLTPNGQPGWRIRFTPTETGEYTLSIQVQRAGSAGSAPLVTKFNVASAPLSSGGWVRLARDGRYLETSDGHPLRLIGENVCWAGGRGTYDFDQWFDGMQKSGQNFARLWFSPWSIGIEHEPGTLTRYKLEDAWQMDHVFQLAEQRGIYLMLCFDHHGMYQVDNQNWGGSNNFWKTNPYNQALGGPCTDPNDFFTDPKAHALYQKRLRYLIARYGYSPQLLAWQFFNEIDNVYAPRQRLQAADVATWHGLMGRWMRAEDPYQHLITTSLTGGSDRPEIWTLPEMDFTMYHSYADPAPGRWNAALVKDYVQRYKKPVMVGEFGVSTREWAIASDPYLRGFRQALWSSALAGSVGTAMSWWWEDIHNDNAYSLYDAMSQILSAAGWHDGVWSPIADLGNPVAPTDLGSALPNGEPFSATLPLSSYRRQPLSWELAIANPLSAERASEAISSFLHGSVDQKVQRPLKLTAIFTDQGKLSFHVNSVASDLDLVVQIDGAEAFRTHLADRDGAPSVNREIDKEFSVNVPAGKHVIQMINTGKDWVNLDSIRLSGVRPAFYAGGWQYAPEGVGLHNAAEKKAALYLYSPYVAYPAGALRYRPPVFDPKSISLKNWPAGKFNARWFDPTTGKESAQTNGVSAGGVLTLPLPPFSDDLAGIVTPAN